MSTAFLHQRKDFKSLISTLAAEKGIIEALWFPEVDLDVPLSEKEAFLLTDDKIREDFKNRYIGTSGLYYQGQPDFNEMLGYIQANLKKLG